jgi:pyruvate formate-lyase activating enzyme-like uncharacterized protein
VEEDFMLNRVTTEALTYVDNPVLCDNLQIYLDIEADFLRQIEAYGLPVSGKHQLAPSDSTIEALVPRGLTIANDYKSLARGWVSPSCLSCRTGMGTATYSISTQCPRDCFFCFNPNQENYERQRCEPDDPSVMLVQLREQGVQLHDLALTGGEPLLHKVETEKFFGTAQQLFPDAYTRLYTSGAFLDADYLERLANAGLNEIRFSIKTDDPPAALKQTLDRIGLARERLERVVVEMPVMPDELELMQGLLLTLDSLGVDGINLLELCFPYHNSEEFKRRGYLIKAEQFRVLYNYWYSGGLPIAGSEEACLLLLSFAFDQELRMGVHYCSLENKFSGQIYQQNVGHQKEYPYLSFSQRDYFLKSVKAYGSDAELVERVLAKHGLKRFRRDENGLAVEFPPTYLERIKAKIPDLKMALSYNVVEGDERGQALRELRLDLITPATFDAATDL